MSEVPLYARALLNQDRNCLTRVRPGEICCEREFFIDNLLFRIHFIIEMIWWTGLAPWDLEFPFPGSRMSTFIRDVVMHLSPLEMLQSR
jgi:hypothetical protein